MIKELENRINEIDSRLHDLGEPISRADELYRDQLLKTKQELMESSWENLSASDRVYLARHPRRQNAKVYINALFSDFFELHGDRLYAEDRSILCGIARFKDIPVTVIAQIKGKSLEENLVYNFGMPNPEAYRKVQRVIMQAEKFNRPIITFIDTPGAYPGLEAERRGQGEAIAKTIAMFSSLSVPVISIVVGEGGSGGALAIGVANKLIMLENAIYSILSPEGFATILWKDSSRADEAAAKMMLCAEDLKKFEVADYIVAEGIGGVMENEIKVLNSIDRILNYELHRYKKLSGIAISKERYEKYRKIGNIIK